MKKNNLLFFEGKSVFYTLILIFLLFGSEQSSAQFDRMRRDGLWWGDINLGERSSYLIGFNRGVVAGSKIVADKFIEGSNCKKKTKIIKDSLQREILVFNPDYVSFRIDSLYKKDSSCLGLMVFHAYWIVVNQLLSDNDKYVQDLLVYYRREDCDKFKNLQELKDYKLSY
jgi:hypothetical protein